MDPPGNGGRQPQTSFGVSRGHRPSYGVVVVGPERGLIEKRKENTRLRFEDGIHALGGDLGPPRDRFDRHSGVALALQELPSGFDDSDTRIACLALANQRFIGTFFPFCQPRNYSIL